MEENLKRIESIVLYSSTLIRIDISQNLYFIVKSVSESEIRYIEIISGQTFTTLKSAINKFYNRSSAFEQDDFKLVYKFLSYFLAHSVVFVSIDNEVYNCLANRQDSIDSLKENFMASDFEILISMFYAVLRNREEDSKSLISIGDFVRTSFCNVIFDSLSHTNLNSYAITGIQGFENVPLSYFQMYFISYMNSYRESLRFNRDFSLFKFVVSAFNRKFIDSVNTSEKREKLQKLISNREDFQNRLKYMTKEGIIEQLIMAKNNILDDFDLVVREEERRGYESWKSTRLESITRTNNVNKGKRGFVEIPVPDEENLIKEYLKIYKYAYWLLDEL